MAEEAEASRVMAGVAFPSDAIQNHTNFGGFIVQSMRSAFGGATFIWRAVVNNT